MDAAAGAKGAAPRPMPAAAAEQQQQQQQQQQQRAATKVLAALEKQIGERIDRDFFAEEGQFRPLVNVIDVLGAADGAVNNVSLERLKGQCELATMAMEKFVDENYGCVSVCGRGWMGYGWGALGSGSMTGGSIGATAESPARALSIDSQTQSGPPIHISTTAPCRYLNGNVEAMGKVLRRFHETSDDVQRLRRQVGG